MKILKKFDSYIKENLEEEDIPEMSLDGDSAITAEMRETEEEKDKKIIDATEEDDSYIGTKMLNELADKLGVEVVDGAIDYNGTKINFFSETEKFHIGKKKFATVDEVVSFIEKENTQVQGEEERKVGRFNSPSPDFQNKTSKFVDDEDSKSDDLKESLITKRFRDFK
jgi:hypothetical protein